jgi:hypothetical protein
MTDWPEDNLQFLEALQRRLGIRNDACDTWQSGGFTALNMTILSVSSIYLHDEPIGISPGILGMLRRVCAVPLEEVPLYLASGDYSVGDRHCVTFHPQDPGRRYGTVLLELGRMVLELRLQREAAP